ncbi:MAG: helix-turn-helix transcriptional regulator [Candidatus Methanomethylophilaceae archaeon]
MKNKVKVYRAIHNLTQEDLASTMRVSRQTIIAIEREKYDPSLSLAFRMANYFHITIEELFRYEEYQEE